MVTSLSTFDLSGSRQLEPMFLGKGQAMGFGIDIVVFIAFVGGVIALGLIKSKSKEKKTGEDYFLAGRGLTWWLVGFSLIAANISTEQFVGMSGKAADWLGMAIASYEWMAAITLVIVAFIFLPTFLRSGIYTIPEFLEYRYNTFARPIMAVSTRRRHKNGKAYGEVMPLHKNV